MRTGGGAYNTSKERVVAGGKDVNLETVGEINTGSTTQPMDVAAIQIILIIDICT